MIAGIHFQYLGDKGETLDKILSANKPFVGFVLPVFLNSSLKNNGREIKGRVYEPKQYYPSWFVDAIKDNKDNPNILWTQEGFLHYCEPCHEKFEGNDRKFPDPFHEHVCVDDWESQSLEKQIEVMRRGRELIFDKTGIKPEGYCPPNHLHDAKTLTAAANSGFRYFNVRNFANLPVYKDGNLIVLPEAKIGELHDKNSPIVFTYYDHLVENEKLAKDFSKVLGNSSMDFDIKSESRFRSSLNRVVVFGYKKMRDAKKRLG